MKTLGVPLDGHVIHPSDDEFARHSDHALERAAKSFEDAGFNPTVKVVHSSMPPVSIVGYGQSIGAWLIALNTRLRTGLSRLVSGNVTMSTVHAAPCRVRVRHPH